MANSINVALNGKVVKIHTKIISVEDFLNENVTKKTLVNEIHLSV